MASRSSLLVVVTSPPVYPAAPALTVVGIILTFVAVAALVAGRRSFCRGVYTGALVCWLAALALSIPQ